MRSAADMTRSTDETAPTRIFTPSRMNIRDVIADISINIKADFMFFAIKKDVRTSTSRSYFSLSLATNGKSFLIPPKYLDTFTMYIIPSTVTASEHRIYKNGL